MIAPLAWLRGLAVLLLGGAAGTLCCSAGACTDCNPGACECADGTRVRVESAPCECRAVCTNHGGVCEDDYAGCPVDAGDAADDGADSDAWPWPWDAGAG